MAKFFSRSALFACCCGGILALDSCGGGGMTLSGGNVDGIWMPDGTHVKVDVDPVEVIYDSNGNPRPRMAPAAAQTALPKEIAIFAESSEKGVLYLDGKGHACVIDYRQGEYSFYLAVESGDGVYSLVFDSATPDSVASDSASSAWRLVRKGPGGYTAQGSGAVLTKLGQGA